MVPLMLLRHGQTEWNAVDRMQGRLDSPLTALGQSQARQQGEILARVGIEGWALYSSPQGRAWSTAQIAYGSAAARAVQDPRLVEIDVGDWTGAYRDAILARHPELCDADAPLDWYDHAPGGEGYAGLEARCRSFLSTLSGPSVLVTHGMTSKMLRCLAMGLPTDDMMAVPGGQGVVHRVEDGRHMTLLPEG